MTKAEIIRKLAKRAGITDLDAKVFFEAFLRKAVLRLEPGDSVKVKGFGYFQRRTGKVKNHIDSDVNNAFANLIVFYPFRSENEDGNENLIFDVPAKIEEEYNLIDSYFSISFGKPVIPLKDANLSEFYIPPVGNELLRLIEMRAEKLLEETEVVENYIKGNELLLIDSGILNPNQMEINWDEKNSPHGEADELFSSNAEETNDQSDKMTWDFGEDLEKEIQEESILDINSEDKLFVDYDDLKEISWEFGLDENEKKPERPFQKEKEPFIPITSVEEINKEIEKPDIKETEKEPTEKENQVDSAPDNFQRVKSFATEFNIDQNKFGLTKSEMDLTWSFHKDENDDDSALLKSITQEINNEGFAEIKYHKRKYKFETDISEPSEQEHDLLLEREIIPEYESDQEQKVVAIPVQEPLKKEIAEPEEKTKVEPSLPKAIIEPEVEIKQHFEEFPPAADRTPGHSKKKGIGIFVVSALFLVICGSIFLYITMSHLFSHSPNFKTAGPVVNNVSSVTIERDFDIPVTYPYIHDNTVKQPIDPFSINLLELDSSKDIKAPEETKPVEKEMPKTETKSENNSLKPVKLKEFIYKSGNNFLVQVSSWPSEPAALKQASFFKNKGFETEIEKAFIGKGYWFRVRVGYFKSENEAEAFFNKYK
jgi:cell division septation protein DedD